MLCSTRDVNTRVCASDAILKGLSKDGGLFIPEDFPRFTLSDIEGFSGLDYAGLAASILSKYLGDYSAEELGQFTRKAYGNQWSTDETAPLKSLSNAHVLELFHGPTCAFKDIALQILPYLLTSAIKKSGLNDTTIAILTATSGDTGKAALEGFHDIDGVKICVFYPDNGVSDMQKLQMTAQTGNNVMVYGINGNFDDAQTGVKRLFTDKALAKELESSNILLSSANSINWGRLAPQVVYYFKAYCDLVKRDCIKLGDKINFSVPTGNFGNILAGYIAKISGLPVNKLICASNQNNVLTEFINTGAYNKNREFYTTASPSMDILVSSNLERLLFLLSERDSEKTAAFMDSLNKTGEYSITPEMSKRLTDEGFCGGYCNEEECFNEIDSVFCNDRYLMDTHTAVAMKVYRDYVSKTGDITPTVVVSTASPFKFPGSVLKALDINHSGNELENLTKLSEISGLDIPSSLASLKKEDVRFKEILDIDDMRKSVMKWLVR
jgi:threonine synthase